jgi:hypothetical protein
MTETDWKRLPSGYSSMTPSEIKTELSQFDHAKLLRAALHEHRYPAQEAIVTKLVRQLPPYSMLTVHDRVAMLIGFVLGFPHAPGEFLQPVSVWYSIRDIIFRAWRYPDPDPQKPSSEDFELGLRALRILGLEEKGRLKQEYTEEYQE